MDTGLPAERTHFPGAHKIGAAISGPRIADTFFTDTKDFLTNAPMSVNLPTKEIRGTDAKLTLNDAEPTLNGRSSLVDRR